MRIWEPASFKPGFVSKYLIRTTLWGQLRWNGSSVGLIGMEMKLYCGVVCSVSVQDTNSSIEIMWYNNTDSSGIDNYHRYCECVPAVWFVRLRRIRHRPHQSRRRNRLHPNTVLMTRRCTLHRSRKSAELAHRQCGLQKPLHACLPLSSRLLLHRPVPDRRTAADLRPVPLHHHTSRHTHFQPALLEPCPLPRHVPVQHHLEAFLRRRCIGHQMSRKLCRASLRLPLPVAHEDHHRHCRLSQVTHLAGSVFQWRPAARQNPHPLCQSSGHHRHPARPRQSPASQSSQLLRRPSARLLWVISVVCVTKECNYCEEQGFVYTETSNM